ncbi:slipin family protein [Nonomuraea thailandensis]
MAWQRVLMYVDGRLKRVLEPGRHRYRPRRTTLLTVDLRPRLLSVPGQELITADGVSVRVTVTAQWRVTDAAAYTEAASVPDQFLYSAVQDAIRERVPALTLEAALADRAALSEGLTERVREEVSGLGIEVGDVRTRDVMLPGELRRAAMDVVIAKERGRRRWRRRGPRRRRCGRWPTRPGCWRSTPPCCGCARCRSPPSARRPSCSTLARAPTAPPDPAMAASALAPPQPVLGARPRRRAADPA